MRDGPGSACHAGPGPVVPAHVPRHGVHRHVVYPSPRGNLDVRSGRALRTHAPDAFSGRAFWTCVPDARTRHAPAGESTSATPAAAPVGRYSRRRGNDHQCQPVPCRRIPPAPAPPHDARRQTHSAPSLDAPRRIRSRTGPTRAGSLFTLGAAGVAPSPAARHGRSVEAGGMPLPDRPQDTVVAGRGDCEHPSRLVGRTARPRERMSRGCHCLRRAHTKTAHYRERARSRSDERRTSPPRMM